MNNMDMKTGSQARSQTAPTSSSAALVSIWAKRFFMDLTGSRRLTCTPRRCSIQFISDYLSTGWTGSKPFSRNRGDCKLLTTFGRHYRRTLGIWYTKEPTSRVAQWQGKEMSNLGCCILGVLAVALRQPQSS